MPLIDIYVHSCAGENCAQGSIGYVLRKHEFLKRNLVQFTSQRNVRTLYLNSLPSYQTHRIRRGSASTSTCSRFFFDLVSFAFSGREKQVFFQSMLAGI